tara:strand:- start:215 stop:493 length:279 start_codon:yes stop_codon:yes gene_type:complete
MITGLRSYKFITYILTSILIIPFVILYILIFAWLLVLIGFATSFLLGPKGVGFLLLSIWGGYRTAKHLLSNRWLEIKRREYDKVKKNNSNIS